jgi:hypothetical protein
MEIVLLKKWTFYCLCIDHSDFSSTVCIKAQLADHQYKRTAVQIECVNLQTSVADPGCLSEFFHPRARVKKIPDHGSGSASKNLSRVFSTQ